MNNPFEAALSLLEGAAFAIRGHAKNREKAEKDCREIANACLVLCAAGKVEKEAWQYIVNNLDSCRPSPNEKDTMNALLAALPDYRAVDAEINTKAKGKEGEKR